MSSFVISSLMSESSALPNINLPLPLHSCAVIEISVFVVMQRMVVVKHAGWHMQLLWYAEDCTLCVKPVITNGCATHHKD